MNNLKENLVSRHLVLSESPSISEQVKQSRQEAIRLFDEKGFPTRKEEEWKYTNLAPLLKMDYKLFPDSKNIFVEYKDVREFFIHDIDSYNIVFINGVYCSFLSQTTHDEADVCVMSSALNKPAHQAVIENYYGKIAPKEDSLVALNTAFVRDGAFIYIPNNVLLSKPIQIMHFSTGLEEQVMFQPRNLIVLGDNSSAQIIERHQTLNGQPNLTNAVTEIQVGKNANLDYYRFQNDTEKASLIDHTFVNQERDSSASMHTFSFGGKLVRNNLNFIQNGENCISYLKGVTIIAGKQHIDHHTLIEHKAPNCESHELYKGIFDEKAHGVFNGKVYVHPEAQKLNAFQQNNNVLLTDEASIDTKPQLEIFADDVKCSHGCTVGQLSDDVLFYMKQRGIPEKEAKALLLYAFASEVLDEVKIPQIKKRVAALITEKLGVSLEFQL